MILNIKKFKKVAVTSEPENPDAKHLRHAGPYIMNTCLRRIFIHDQSVTRVDRDGTLLVLPDNNVAVTQVRSVFHPGGRV
jgi:hypothetical protein